MALESGAKPHILNWDYSRHYARFHRDTAGDFAGTVGVISRWLAPHLQGRADRVLDVGCGRGYALAAARAMNIAQVEGIDTSKEQVAWATDRGLPARHVGDTRAYLEQHPQYFDAILLMDVIEHVAPAEQRGFLLSIAGSLRPGGRLLLSTPNGVSRLAGYTRHLDYTHTMAFTPESLDFLLIHSGFEPARYEELEVHTRPRLLFLAPTPRALRWWALRALRAWRRLELTLEIGRERAKLLPVSPAFLAIAHKSERSAGG